MTHLSAGKLQGLSAGSTPTGQVNPGALAVLKKHGVPITGPRSKSWDEFTGETFRFVITVCDSANQEVCPVFHGGFEKLHWSIPDPANAVGDDIEPAFEAAFQLIKSKIESELLTKIDL